MSDSLLLPTIADITAAAARIAGMVVRTPIITAPGLDAAVNAKVFVKAECLQHHGSFKLRGASNRIAAFSQAERANGVVAFSSGNHAIAVAAAAKAFGVPAVIVMPADAPAIKRERTTALGGEVVLYDRQSEDREAIGAVLARDRGLALVRPFDDPLVIAGQGTAGLELAEDVPDLDVVLVCASGGGLCAGVALGVQALSPKAQIYAIEPEGHDDIALSLAAGQRVANPPGVRSICDALLVDKMGAIPFAIGQTRFAGAIAVSDQEVKAAMRFAFAELKLVLEPGGAIALAAALSGGLNLAGARVGVIASGGNVDPALYAEILVG
jgi:threonine dehydratase